MRPSTSTVQAPQTPCSQPTWVPVRARSCAQEIRQRHARLDDGLVGDAVDRHANLIALSPSSRTSDSSSRTRRQPARPAASASPRRVSTCARSRRYSAEACTSRQRLFELLRAAFLRGFGEDGLAGRLARQTTCFRSARAQRASARRRRARSAHPSSGPRRRASAVDRGAHHREVAVPPRDLLDRPAGALGAAPARAPRSAPRSRRARWSGTSRRSRRPGCCARRRARRRGTRRPSASATAGYSAAGSAWAIEPPTVPRLRICGWAIQRVALVQQRLALAHERRSLDRPLGRHGADGEPAVRLADVVEVGDPAEVEQQLRTREPHVEQRHQALAAGQDLGLARRVAASSETRLGHRVGGGVFEGRRLHAGLLRRQSGVRGAGGGGAGSRAPHGCVCRRGVVKTRFRARSAARLTRFRYPGLLANSLMLLPAAPSAVSGGRLGQSGIRRPGKPGRAGETSARIAARGGQRNGLDGMAAGRGRGPRFRADPLRQEASRRARRAASRASPSTSPTSTTP